MRKALVVVLLVLLTAQLLVFTAFADILPPSFYTVTVGDKPVTRYKMEHKDGGSDALVEDGTLYAGYNIRVLDIITVNGKKYGEYQERVYLPEAERNSSGNVWGGWKTYYFLLEDVLSPSEMATAEPGAAEGSTVLIATETQLETKAKTETTVTATVASTTVAAQPSTTQSRIVESGTIMTETGLETIQETETYSETQGTDATFEENTVTAFAIPENVQRRSPQKTILVCVGAAVVFTLTSTVTLALIRRRRSNKQNTLESEKKQ